MPDSAPDHDLHARIIDDIGNGTYPSGSRLKVQELAKRYGTSIIPVREALRTLQGEGLVEITRNKGATVSTLDADVILEIFEVLQLLEPYLVRDFAQSCRPQDLDEMEMLQAQMIETDPTNKPAFAALDKAFHAVVARSHYNRRASAIWELQRRSLNALAATVPLTRSRHRELLQEHAELLAAFRANDVEGAVACIEKHVAGAGDQMYQQLRRLRPS
ncbi:GntR family transcriptional regulator [Jannaschia sp. M317]|uniref:GntR family transcriptional regulator n=1 Tax=Jannaschia sp. M317 TaxID=2867011 RepID=UPI0021A80651|nr:GntR family transcriptional regulator [Jannaschia sp. M317]UWQ19954.1 GntR family transcriptional regulator [Jannaschia sp. M317]